MKKLISALLLIFVLTSCHQKEPDKWTALFNGKDLEGWAVKGTDATFEIEEGMVVGTNRGRQNTFLATEERYSDFIFELEVWADPRMNSGIQFRSNQKESGRVFGYQAEIDPSERAYSGGIYDEARRDWLYPLSLNAAGQKAFRINEWNTYRIEALGTSMRVWVNNVCTAVLEDNMTPEGFIALQVHGVGDKKDEGRQVKWRNARILTEGVEAEITPLPKDIYQLNLVPNLLTEHELAQGWEWLMSPEIINTGLGHIEDWTGEEGVLTNTGFTETSTHMGFGNSREQYEFSFQFKLDSASECQIAYLVENKEEKNYQLVVPAKYERADSLYRPGALKGEIAPQNLSYAGMGERYLKGAGQWNTGRIVVSNGRAEHWMNNFKLIDYAVTPDDSEEIKTLTIAGVSGKAYFRNLKIKSLN